MNNPCLWVSLLAVMNALWAGSYIAVKLGLESLDPLALIFWRYLSALAVLLLIIAVKRPSLRVSSRDLIRIASAGALVGGSSWLWVCGIRLSQATDASLLYVFEPIWGMILAGVVLRERILPTTIAGLAIVLAGLAGLSNFDLKAFGFGGGAGEGNLLVVASLLCDGLYSIILKPTAARVSALIVAAGTVAAALAVVSVPMALGGKFAVPAAPAAVLSIAYLAVICSVVGYTLWIAAMKHVPVGIMLFTIFVQPICGPFLASAFLGERIDSRVVVGGTLLLSGMFVAVAGHMHARRRRPAIAAEEPVPIVGGV